MPERPYQEIVFDARYTNQYLAIREELAADGQTKLGVVIAHGELADDVYSKLVEDQKKYGKAIRHFYKPMTGENRESWTIGGNE